jgi:hypothetical protein
MELCNDVVESLLRINLCRKITRLYRTLRKDHDVAVRVEEDIVEERANGTDLRYSLRLALKKCLVRETLVRIHDTYVSVVPDHIVDRLDRRSELMLVV